MRQLAPLAWHAKPSMQPEPAVQGRAAPALRCVKCVTAPLHCPPPPPADPAVTEEQIEQLRSGKGKLPPRLHAHADM